jgi:hypothetical protein
MENIFNILEQPQYDESIAESKCVEYHPIIGTNLNSDNAEINIIIENQDVFALPHLSYLYVEGKLSKADSTSFAAAENISLINNGIMYLFKNIKYDISGRIVENINNPGITGVVKGLLTYDKQFGDRNGLQICWNTSHSKLQDYIIKQSDPRGTFSFQIPLKHIFGFCEDYDKIIYGVKHQLILLRNQDNDAVYKIAAPPVGSAPAVMPDDGKVTLTKLTWLMPHIVPNDLEKIQLYKQIERKAQLPIAFRQRQMDKITIPQGTTSFSWRLLTTTIKPRWIIVVFQTDKDNSQVKDTSTFDNCDLFNIKAVLNSENYPQGIDLNLNFARNSYAKAYQMYENFKRDYYGDTNVCIDPIEFKSKYSLFVIDCSRQSERLKMGVIDIKLEIQFNSAVADKTVCYAFILSDRIMSLNSDGSKMELII